MLLVTYTYQRTLARKILFLLDFRRRQKPMTYSVARQYRNPSVGQVGYILLLLLFLRAFIVISSAVIT